MTKRKRTVKEPQMVASSRQSNKKDVVPFLPREIITDILHWLPAEFLYDSGRYVCKTWADILHIPSFIKSQLLHADCGFLIQDISIREHLRYFSLSQGKFKETDLNLDFPGFICDSCDGILLIFGPPGDRKLHVVNPITRRGRKLPGISREPYFLQIYNKIGRIPDTGVFKVVSFAGKSNDSLDLFVLTVGVDMTWRKITSPRHGISGRAFETAACIHGVIYFLDPYEYNNLRVVAVDLRDESINYAKPPIDRLNLVLMQMGENVCLMHHLLNEPMTIWLLKDFYGNEWVKFKSVNLNEIRVLKPYFILAPMIYLDSQQVLIITRIRKMKNNGLKFEIAGYHMSTGKCEIIIGEGYQHYFKFFKHTNSLVCI